MGQTECKDPGRIPEMEAAGFPYVGPSGPSKARLVLIGEAPGRPFVGRAGKLLNRILGDAGITRLPYLTNVVKYRPPDNDFDLFRRHAPTVLQWSKQELFDELASVEPEIVVPLGNEAISALLGKRGITKLRGSIYRVEIGGRECTVIPTFHPANLLPGRSPRNYGLALHDLKTVAEALRGIPITYEEEDRILINPTFKETMEWLNTAGEVIAFDIERIGGTVACLGIADGVHNALVIPFVRQVGDLLESYWTLEEELALLSKLKRFFSSRRRFVGQNASFDLWYLGKLGIGCADFYLDTMLAHHTLDSASAHDLGFLASLYTSRPYFKDQIKWRDAKEDEDDSAALEIDSIDRLWRYNATDCLATWEIAQKLEAELERAGLSDLFFNYVMKLPEPLLAMQKRGIKIDIRKRSAMKRETTKEINRLSHYLSCLAAPEIASRAGSIWDEFFSPPFKGRAIGKARALAKEISINWGSQQQVARLFHEDLGWPVQKRTEKTGRASVDEEAVIRLLRHFQRRHGKIPPLLEAFRKVNELQNFYSKALQVATDADGRCRCSYRIHGTDTGRLASRKSFDGSGTNLQNRSPEERAMFIADPGMIMFQADLERAETWVVAALADDTNLLEKLRANIDIHTYNAARLFGVAEEDVTPDQRYLAKRAGHGFNYGMGPRTLRNLILEDDYARDISEADCKLLLARFKTIYHKIVLWQRTVERVVKQRRAIRSPTRRRLLIRPHGPFVSGHDVRKALSFIPQDVVCWVIGQALIDLFKKTDVQLLLQVHDAIVGQVPEGKEEEYEPIIRGYMERPMRIGRHEITIPVEIAWGRNWKECK